MRIERVWAMPNKWTFQIPPIAELVAKYVGDGKGWIDPFAGKSMIVELRNDATTDQPSKMDAIEYLKKMRTSGTLYNGALLDPPYSFRQLFKTYKTCGDNLKGRLVPMTEVNNLVAPLIRKNGIVISFGWNSNGLGMKRGFEIQEILIVAHGGHHNDTIITVENRRR